MKNTIKKLEMLFNYKSKKYLILKILLSLFFAITLVLDKNLVTNNYIRGKLENNYFQKMQLIDIPIFIGFSILTFLIISIIEKIYDKIEPHVYSKQEHSNKKAKNVLIFILINIVILLFWLPYVLSYFPGGIFADTMNSLAQAYGTFGLTNHNPILYTLLLKGFVSIGTWGSELLNTNISGKQFGLELFTLFQVELMAITCTIVIFWQYRKNISKIYIILTTLFFSLFKLIPLYAVSIWKDTPFCVVLAWYILLLIETVLQNGDNLKNWKYIVTFFIVSLLVAFLRNNGIYIITLSSIFLILFYRKNNIKIFSIITIVEILLCYIVQGPIYDKAGMSTEFVESIGVPLQQIAYTVVSDGNITNEQMEFIDQLCPIKTIKKLYYPFIVDDLKMNSKFNHQFLEENKAEFFKVWFEIFLQNPGAYINAYLLNTVGFWDVNQATFDAYVNPLHFWNEETLSDVTQWDYVLGLTKESIRDKLYPKKAISSAVFVFITLLCMLITIYKNKPKNILGYIPGIATWLTLMIAVPLAFSLRYIYILCFMLPISLLIPLLKNTQIKSTIEIINNTAVQENNDINGEKNTKVEEKIV